MAIFLSLIYKLAKLALATHGILFRIKHCLTKGEHLSGGTICSIEYNNTNFNQLLKYAH